LDTVRLDHVGWAGFDELPTTPMLDKLAQQGAAFTGAISQSSWTKPATGTILTGLVPNKHQAIGRPTSGTNLKLPANVRTIQDAFASAGWFTSAVSSNPNISSQFGFSQGFMRFAEDTSMCAEQLLTIADDFIEDTKHRPWFMYLHLNDAHYPYLAPGKWRGKFANKGSRGLLTGPTERDYRNRESSWTADDIEQMRLAWCEELAYLDAIVGGWVEKQLNGDPNLLVVIVADHGEEFLDHGDLGHGHTLNDELLKVPLQFAWGRNWDLQSGLYSQQLPVMDLPATLLDLCSIQWPQTATPLDGISFAPVLRSGTSTEDRPAFSETESPGSPLSGMSGPLRSWCKSDWKWIETSPWSPQANRGWLYEITNDSNEQQNLCSINPLVVTKLRQEMRNSGLLNQVDRSHIQMTISQSTQEELAALGYLDEASGNIGYFAPNAVPWQECSEE